MNTKATLAGIGLGVIAVTVLAVGVHYTGGTASLNRDHTVTYEAEADSATGAGRTGFITMQTGDGGTSQATVPLPLTVDGHRGITGPMHSGSFVYISVQNQQGSGSVTCRITIDGKVVSENIGSGAYAIATCQGTVPR